jgi:hypothetical protein
VLNFEKGLTQFVEQLECHRPWLAEREIKGQNLRYQLQLLVEHTTNGHYGNGARGFDDQAGIEVDAVESSAQGRRNGNGPWFTAQVKLGWTWRVKINEKWQWTIR